MEFVADSLRHQIVTGNTNSFNVSTNHNNIVNFVTEIDPEEEDQILQWLSPLEPQRRHQSVRTGRLDGIGYWVLETNKFRKWSDREDGCAEPVLFCCGNPGVGKTYLRYASHLEKDVADIADYRQTIAPW